jgi:hypothetical protein
MRLQRLHQHQHNVNTLVSAACLQDLTLLADMPADLWDNSTGHTQVSTLMASDSLDSLPLNMSRIDRNVLLLRGYYVDRSDASNGQFGVESFQDVFLKWQQAQPAAGSSKVLIAAIVAPIVVAAALAALAAAMFVVWRRRKAAAAAGAASAAHSSVGKGDLLPRVFADAGRYSEDKLSRNNSDTGPSPDSAVLAARSADQRRTHSNTSSLTSLSKAKSGPSQDIALACKNLVLHRTANEPDELILQSVLGEGSYGKVGTPGSEVPFLYNCRFPCRGFDTTMMCLQHMFSLIVSWVGSWHTIAYRSRSGAALRVTMTKLEKSVVGIDTHRPPRRRL